MQGAYRPDTLSEGQIHEGEHNATGPEPPKAIPFDPFRSARAQVSLGDTFLRDDDTNLARSEEHILAMIARITSPIPGPSTSHRPRRKTFRAVAQGVVFIQRVKYVSCYSPPAIFLICG